MILTVFAALAGMVLGLAFAGSPSRLASGVRIAGVDVGGRTPHQARSILERRAGMLASTPVTFRVGSKAWRLEPRHLGIRVDWGAAVDAVRGRYPQVRAVADVEALVAEKLDILSPCALGGTLNERVVNALTARIVCGGANNQLAHHGIEKLLADRGILYAPDYVVNSGGVIQVADELAGFSFERARAATEQIFVTTGKVLAIADADGVPPSVAADRLAERRMSEVGRLRGIWLGTMGSA